MNTKLEKVRQDSTLKMNDILLQTWKMRKGWFMGLGGTEHCGVNCVISMSI